MIRLSIGSHEVVFSPVSGFFFFFVVWVVSLSTALRWRTGLTWRDRIVFSTFSLISQGITQEVLDKA